MKYKDLFAKLKYRGTEINGNNTKTILKYSDDDEYWVVCVDPNMLTIPPPEFIFIRTK